VYATFEVNTFVRFGLISVSEIPCYQQDIEANFCILRSILDAILV
jgi:hypothetical protein